MTKNYCAAPWRGLHIQVDGGISTCCAGGFKLGNINHDTIESALASDKLKAVRESIKRGELPDDYCGLCKHANANHVGNEQDWHNSLNTDFDIDSAGTEYQYPVIFDARWNNTCNSTCVYCGPMWSSKWASIKSVRDQKPNKDNKSKITDYFEKHGHKLKTMSMVGGEPLLMKENELLLESLPEHVSVDIITNLTSDVSNSRVFEKLMQRPKVNWHISLENVGDRYEYVRQGSEWKTLLGNLELLGSAVRNPPEKNDHEIQFISLYHILNATRLCELKEFTQEVARLFPHKYQQGSQIEIVWQNFSSPVALCVEEYGKDFLDKALTEMSKYLKMDLNQQERKMFENKFTEYQGQMNLTSEKTKKALVDFVKSNEDTFDNHGSFEKLWPELVFLLS